MTAIGSFSLFLRESIGNAGGVTYGGQGDPFDGMWFNIVGTQTGDDQISYDLLCTDNHVYISGPSTGGAPNIGLGIFPVGYGSIYYNFEISRNTIICGPGQIWPIFANGTGFNGIIADNIVINCDGTAGPAITVSPQPSNSASYTTIVSVSCVTGSANITMNWPNHGYNSVWLSYAPVWMFINGTGPTFGGITLGGYYRIVSTTTNSVVFAIPSGGTLPTSPATSAWISS